MLSSTAYERTLEIEADLTAVDYLIRARVNPRGLAGFLYRLEDTSDKFSKLSVWISTHPNSSDQSKEIYTTAEKEKVTYQSVVNIVSWNNLKEKVKQLNNSRFH